MKNSKFVGLLIAMIIFAVALTLLISFPFVSEYYYIKGLKNGRDLGLKVGIKRGMKAQQLAFEITLARLKECEKNNNNSTNKATRSIDFFD